jgi:catechol-2,3-dioxygenase
MFLVIKKDQQKMEFFSNLHLHDLAIRVSDRDLELNFYHYLLGLDILLEEGAVSVLGIKSKKRTRLVIEESPNAISIPDGIRKLHAFSWRVPSKNDLLGILNRLDQGSYPPDLIWETDNACGFRVSDPENNRMQIYYSDQAIFNNEENKDKFRELNIEDLLSEDDKIENSLSDIYIDAIKLNVVAKAESKIFYEKLFKTKFISDVIPIVKTQNCFSLALKENDQGNFLQKGVEQYLDIEYLEFDLEKSEKDQLKEYLNQEQIPYHQSGQILIVPDPSGIEWWFVGKKAL